MADRTRAEELYDEHRNKVWEDIKSGTENFDRHMLTFSSGALALSLAFIKDVVPIGKAVCVPSLIISWCAFVLCILVTLASFRISIRAQEETIPHLRAYYLEGRADSFDKHLKSLWTRAVDWCAYLGILFFIVGLAATMVFVGANIREANRVSRQETTKVQKGPKPAAMTPISEGVKPVAMTIQTQDALSPIAMTPVVTAENRGTKPASMTPQPQPPAPAAPAPAQPTQSTKK